MPQPDPPRVSVLMTTHNGAPTIRDADGGLKDKTGRLAYVWTGARNLKSSPVKMRIKVDGEVWFDDDATCVLFGNVGKLFGGMTTFQDAEPDDGLLELGVVTADGVWQWMRALARTATRSPAKSPFIEMTSGHKFSVRFSRPIVYEIAGPMIAACEATKFSTAPVHQMKPPRIPHK